MVHLNAYASAEDPDIAAAMRHHLSRIYRYVIHLLERDGHPNIRIEEAGGFLFTRLPDQRAQWQSGSRAR